MTAVAADAYRAERAEAAFWASYARNITTTDATRDTGAVPVAGGFALCLQGTSLDVALGVGTARPIRPDDLAIVDEFYGGRGLASQLELHPAVAARDDALLGPWGFTSAASSIVLEQQIDHEPPLEPPFSIDVMNARRAEWVDLVRTALHDTLNAAPSERTRRTVAVHALAASLLVAVRCDGRLAAGGAVGIIGDVALLFGAATLPEFRRRGAYTALVRARLSAARARGATLAAVSVPPGTGAAGGAERAGFRRLYERQRYRKPRMPAIAAGGDAAS